MVLIKTNIQIDEQRHATQHVTFRQRVHTQVYERKNYTGSLYITITVSVAADTKQFLVEWNQTILQP
jgi:hypothetical protein